MGILDDYEAYMTKYQKIYGERTIVLLQNGHFFEMYGVDNDKIKIGLVREMSELLNIQMTRRNKAILENSRENCLLAGFPTNQLDRYVTMLTEEYGYVVIIVEQISPAPNPKRGVTNIVGPGTNIKYLSRPNSSYLLSIYIESEGKKVSQVNQVKDINMLTIGLAAIDVSTGQSLVYQVCNMIDDENRALDETYRFIQTLQPKEILINLNQVDFNESQLSAYLDLSNRLVHYRSTGLASDYRKLSFQNNFLRKVFTNTGMLQPIEYIDMEKWPTALISYLLMIEFCYDQNETIINQIEKPLIWDDNEYLILDNNTINQLNIASNENNKQSNLLNLIDQTSTAMGKRLLKQTLLQPILKKDELEKRYDYIDILTKEIDGSKLINKKLNGHKKHYMYQKYEPLLNQINDIERYHRKICLGLLNPNDWNFLHSSYQHVKQIMEELENSQEDLLMELVCKELRKNFVEYMDYYQKVLNLQETTKYTIQTIEGSFFNCGYNQEIDDIQGKIDDYNSFFNQLVVTLSNQISPKADNLVDHEFNDDLGHHLSITTSRWNTFLSKHNGQAINIKTKTNNYVVYPQKFGVIKNRNGKNCKLICPQMDEVSKKLNEYKTILLKKVVEVYSLFLGNLYRIYSLTMKQLTSFISVIDLYKSNAKTVLLYNYCRPKIDDTKDYSYVEAKQIRHPLIERLQETCQYVAQDVDFNGSNRGILLFGINCSGKSSLMKAIGMSIVLAQAGLYVPASEFVLSPYKTILTRIIGNDNLFKGLSSFAVEMSELRGIMKRANNRSLVLGDEICHGTETISAVSIVSSAIITLSNLNTSFLFATHLHQLSELERITSLKNISMYHLKVKFHETTGKLIYDRRLEKGPGHPIYGLEVAKAMDLDRQFIELANEIRKEIMSVTTFVPFKKSKYNKEVYMDMCCIPECHNPAVDTHHIKFQSHANPKGFIDHIQKNHKSNLIPLCKQCHQMVHNQQPQQLRYIINGYQMTDNGPELNYEKIINSHFVELDPCENYTSNTIDNEIMFQNIPTDDEKENIVDGKEKTVKAKIADATPSVNKKIPIILKKK